MFGIRRREFISLLGGAAAAWPLAARAQQPDAGDRVSQTDRPRRLPAAARFSPGPQETGYVEGGTSRSTTAGPSRSDRLPELAAQLVRRQVAVIVTAGASPQHSRPNATTTIPIVFGVSDDPVKHGLVASLARPGGNLTGVIF